MTTEQQKKEFIEEYNKLLDQIAAHNGTRLFWSTDFASKNRFSSLLPDVMEGIAAGKPVEPQGWWQSMQFHHRKIAALFLHFMRIAQRMRLARRYLPLPDRAKTYTVIKTFIYDHSFDAQGQYKDVFFTRLPEHLRARGEVVIYAHVLGDFKACVQKAKDCGIPVVTVESMLTFPELAVGLWEALFVPIRVPKQLRFCGKDVGRVVSQEFWRSFKGVQLWQFVHFWATANLAKLYKINSFIMTYENYPWERMAIMALRQASPQTKITGYQHTVVPQAYLNYFVSSAEKNLLPDRVLTVGQHPADIMARYGHQERSSILPACALRFEYLAGGQEGTKPEQVRNILIPLEGFYHVYPMVAFALKQMGNHPHARLRIRTHPLLPWDKYEQRYQPNAAQYSNVEISKGTSLKEDLAWADIVLYWSSTVCIEALMMGKPVIHMDRSPVLSYDPLFDCPYFKKTVRLEDNLIAALQYFESMPLAQWQEEQRKVKAYIAGYFYPVNSATLDAF